MDLSKVDIESLQSFNSTNEAIDDYFKKEAKSDTTSKSFVVLNKREDMPSIIGTYSLCCSGYVYQFRDRIYINPAVEVKYFAINEYYQDAQHDDDVDFGCLSSNIFSIVIGNIINFTDNYCGANKIILYAVPDAVKFYKRMGFKPFEDYMLKTNERYLEGCSPMYLDLNEMT